MLSICEYFINPYNLFPNELTEGALIRSHKYNMTLEFNPSETTIGNDYFKVYQGTKIKKHGETPFARISFHRPEYVIHNKDTSESKWVLSTKERRKLIALLNEPNTDEPSLTNWQYLIRIFNEERKPAAKDGKKLEVRLLKENLPMPDYSTINFKQGQRIKVK